MKTFSRQNFRVSPRGFTLIELLVVIAIIAILMGLLFPAIGSVKEQARKVQAKNDETQLVNAIKAYYTEYGKYPLQTQGADFVTDASSQDDLMNVLRANGLTWDAAGTGDLNPRNIVFMEVPTAKDANSPRGGVGPNDGVFYDPWGKPYFIAIDGDYDNQLKAVSHGYFDTSFGTLNTGVIVWSYGKDGTQGTKGDKKYSGSDDVISWQ